MAADEPIEVEDAAKASVKRKRLETEPNQAIRKARHDISCLREYFIAKHLEVIEPFLIKSALERWRKKAAEMQRVSLPAPPVLESQPKCIEGGTMRDYQLQGLNWFIEKHHYGVGGILGDEMGLGKTLQVISFLAYLHEQHISGPHLVVCPLSTIDSWMTELKRWCPTLRPLRFHGTQPELHRLMAEEAGVNQFDVLVTTYEMVTAALSFLTRKYTWRYLIIDEAHRIKNACTLAANSLRHIKPFNTFMLTGTPLQNNLRELWSLLSFLFPDVFTDDQPFADAFQLGSEQSRINVDALAAANRLLAPLMLRRTKKVVEKSLPPKTETKLFVPLSAYQRFWYKRLLAKDVGLFDPNAREGEAPQRWQQLMSLFMQLRKCCDHPFLFPDSEPEPFVNSEALVAASGKMQVLDKLLNRLRQDGHRVLIFSQFTKMLDILEDYVSLREWPYSRLDGSTPRAQRAFDIRHFNSDTADEFIFLISTRAGGLGINLMSADTVVLFDSDFNPQVDLQAMDRVHRIGQKNPVSIYRLISSATVEERLVRRAEQKLLLHAMVSRDDGLHAMQAASDDKLTTNELLSSIKFGADRIFNAGDEDITETDLDSIVELSRQHERLQEDCKWTAADVDKISLAALAVRDFQGTNWRNCSMKDIANDWKAAKEGGDGAAVGVEAETWEAYGHFFPNMAAVPQKKRHIISTFRTQDICFCCRDGGELVCCDVCPRVYHIKCVGLAAVPTKKWRCPSHTCFQCGRNATNAGGLLFWCTQCPTTYCDDHCPTEAVYFKSCLALQLLGFDQPHTARYIACGPACAADHRAEELSLQSAPQLSPWQRLPDDVQVLLSRALVTGTQSLERVGFDMLRLRLVPTQVLAALVDTLQPSSGSTSTSGDAARAAVMQRLSAWAGIPSPANRDAAALFYVRVATLLCDASNVAIYALATSLSFTLRRGAVVDEYPQNKASFDQLVRHLAAFLTLPHKNLTCNPPHNAVSKPHATHTHASDTKTDASNTVKHASNMVHAPHKHKLPPLQPKPAVHSDPAPSSIAAQNAGLRPSPVPCASPSRSASVGALSPRSVASSSSFAHVPSTPVATPATLPRAPFAVKPVSVSVAAPPSVVLPNSDLNPIVID